MTDPPLCVKSKDVVRRADEPLKGVGIMIDSGIGEWNLRQGARASTYKHKQDWATRIQDGQKQAGHMSGTRPGSVIIE